MVNSQDRPLKVNSIRIDGVDYTRRSVVENLVKPVLQSENLGDIISESREACHRLSRLGVFKDVGVTLDTPTTPYGDAGEVVDVVLTVKEGPRLYARTGADFSNYDTTTVRSWRPLSQIISSTLLINGQPSHGIIERYHADIQCIWCW